MVADYYYKKTVDLHYDKILPYYTGYSSQTQNIGSKSNKGWEFSLNTQNLVGDFKWSTSLNIALNREKVLDLGVMNTFIQMVPEVLWELVSMKLVL